jgi:hypothetical protein
LVDAKVLDGDGPENVTALTMVAPQRTDHSVDRVEIELVEGGF